jgi:hypothetical protein
MLGFLAKIALLASLALIPLSLWHRGDMPSAAKVLPSLDDAPRQTATNKAPFEIGARGMRYTVTPRFKYELNGMLVSMHDAGSLADTTHAEMQDHVNVVDLCVAWGSAVREEIYREYNFSNTDTFCFLSPKSDKSRTLAVDTVSNNHLVTGSPTLAAELRKLRPGDQIHLSGYLVNYSRKAEDGATWTRQTSTVRTDTGDGACEVMFVSELEMLRPYENVWHMGLKVGVALLVISLLAMVFAYGSERPARPAGRR